MDHRQPSGITHWSNTAHAPQVLGVNANLLIPWLLWALLGTSTLFLIAFTLTAVTIWVQVIKGLSFVSGFRALRILLTGRLKTTRGPLRDVIRR